MCTYILLKLQCFIVGQDFIFRKVGLFWLCTWLVGSLFFVKVFAFNFFSIYSFTTRKTGYCGGPKPPLKPKKAPLKVLSTYCGGPSRQCCSAAISRLRRQQKAPLQMSLLAAGEGLLRRAQNRRHMCSKFVALAFSGGVMPAAIVSTFQRRLNSATINNKSKQVIVLLAAGTCPPLYVSTFSGSQ